MFALGLVTALILLGWHNRQLRTETRRRLAAQQALAAERDLLAAVFDATTDAILVLDQDLRVLTANQTAAQRFHRDLATLRGQDILRLTESEVVDSRRQRYAQAFATGLPACFRDTRSGRTYDNVLYPLPATSHEPARLAIYARDVTEALEADRELRERRERLDKIFQLTPAVITILTHPGWQYRDVNKTFTDITGYTRQDVFGHDNEALGLWLAPEDKLRIQEGIEKQGVVRNLEIRVRHKDGHIVTGLLSCTLLEAYGEPCALGVMMDITERKTMEHQLRQAKDAAEAASQAKTRFLSVMSHEVRTPMNTILGMVDVLRDTGLTGRQPEFLSALEQAAESLLGLLEDVLTVSRIASGTFKLRPTTYDPAAIARQSVAANLPRATAKGLELSVTIAPGVPAEAVGDTTALRQVLDHLLDNAIKFTPAGRVRLELGLPPDATAEAVLRFTIIDTGEGIPPAMWEAVFEPFTLIDASTTRSHGGAGLGLALCALLVRSMGGDVGLTSEPGKGSAFHFTVPADLRTVS